MTTLENNEIFDYFTKSNDETYIEVTEKDFNWLVKSKFTIDEIVYQLEKILKFNFTLTNGEMEFYVIGLSPSLKTHLEMQMGRIIPVETFTVAKCIAKGVRFERVKKHFKFDEVSGIYRVTKKSLKKLVNSGIDVGLIKDSLRYTCYELSLSASMKINELLDDSIGLSTDEKIAVFVKLKRQKANSEETSETEDAQDGKDVFVTPDKIKELERVLNMDMKAFIDAFLEYDYKIK